MSRLFVCAIFLFVSLTVPLNLLAEIKVEGASTILPVVKDAGKEFYRMTGIKVVAKGGGSMTGVRAVLEGNADIGMVSRSLTAEEADKLQTHLIGYDGIAVILNATIPLNEIPREQVVNIFSGAITNWRSFTGKGKEITVIVKRNGRSTRRLFDHFFSLEKVIPTAQVIGSNSEAIILVAGDPTAIGYVSIGSAERAVQLGLHLKLLPLDGVEATSENIANEKYPLRRSLNLVTLGEPGKDALRFIEFLKNEEGQEFVRKNHFVIINKKGTTK